MFFGLGLEPLGGGLKKCIKLKACHLCYARLVVGGADFDLFEIKLSHSYQIPGRPR